MPKEGIANIQKKWYKFAMGNSKHTEHCMVCGTALEYLQQSERRACTYCGKAEEGHIACREGHFVCDRCHGADARKAIEDIAFTTEQKDPAAIAELMMSHPNLPMLGCEHAFIVAGALMAALRNSPYGKGKITSDTVREAFERTAKQAIGGYCGLTGVCGIAPAVGACFSLFLGARCGSDSEQKITMEAVISVSRVIAGLTGPSCCKAYVRAALAEAGTVFAERFGIVLPATNTGIICRHSGLHPHGCREDKCPYFQKPSKDIFAEAKFVPGTVCTS
jgi:hypothetical protein